MLVVDAYTGSILKAIPLHSAANTIPYGPHSFIFQAFKQETPLQPENYAGYSLGRRFTTANPSYKMNEIYLYSALVGEEKLQGL